MKSLFLRFLFPLILGVSLGWPASVFGQTLNFKPLDRGDYTEEEQKLFLLQGVEVKGDFGIGLLKHDFSDLTAPDTLDKFRQDFRLNLRTVFHREIEMHLNLETLPANLAADTLRAEQPDNPSHVADSQEMMLHPREAYLKFKFNPRSSLIAGKQQISLGDRRGKVFDGILPALTYDCQVGTWCFPLGMARTGEFLNDWIFHFALQYTAWDTKKDGFRDVLEVELFRVFYTETNIPLATNRGPGTFNPGDPTTPGNGQAVDSGNEPIFFKANALEYFGLRVNMEKGQFFWNFDATLSQGPRFLHPYRYTDGTTTAATLNLNGTSEAEFRQSISGVALETEIGYRMKNLRMGTRLMTASGDPEIDSATPELALSEAQKGFYEIVPGSYRGARLYFNGTRGDVGTGDGLGHSINNTRMYGYFLDYADPVGNAMAYKLGIFKLELNNSITAPNGGQTNQIGLEIDNLISFYLRRSLKLDLEFNIIRSMGAFRTAPLAPLANDASNYMQGIVRLVYQF